MLIITIHCSCSGENLNITSIICAVYRHTNREAKFPSVTVGKTLVQFVGSRVQQFFPKQIWIVRHFFEGDRVITKYEASELRRNCKAGRFAPGI